MNTQIIYINTQQAHTGRPTLDGISHSMGRSHWSVMRKRVLDAFLQRENREERKKEERKQMRMS